MKKLSFLGALLLTACVTINIYFPAAAAEKAADELIKDIQKQAPSKDAPAVKPQSHWSGWQLAIWQKLDAALDVVISPAHAEADLAIDSPEIRQISAEMQRRFSALSGWYAKGSIGILSDGMLGMRDPNSVGLQDRGQLSQLISAENADRQKLYQAIANANGHPEWASQIKATFASRWVSNAQGGWWYQTTNGSWKQK